MRVLSAITDPQYVPQTHFSAYEKFWLRIIQDPRDLPFIHLLTRIHLIVFPWVFLMFTPLFQGVIWWLVFIPYAYVSQSYFKGRFGLMFHCLCHRMIFKKEYQWIQKYVTWIVCPFFGHTPETYFGHHIIMHHVENNMEDDTSSTLRYQRDSPRDFLKYLVRFLVIGFVDTFYYLFNRKKKKVYVRFTMGELTWLTFCAAMCFVNLKATIMIFVVPVLYGRFIMMMGNWTQHAFIDAKDPDGHFSSVFNCINNVYNQNCWNDGYHSIHHFNPGLHYTEMPGVFLKNLDNFKKHKSFIFDGIHYLHIFFWIMNKRYDKLADHLVNLDNTFSSQAEAEALIRERLRPVMV